MALFPSGEFTSLFRLLDDYDVHRSGRSAQSSTIRAFRPKFDVRELKDAYELQGELPGIDQKDVNIEFVDPNTMVISGRVDRSYAGGKPPGTATDAPADKSGKATGQKEGTKSPNAQAATEEEPDYTYWVSERSVGEFHRSFTFPSNVNHDVVAASLKSGVLTVTVPKAAPPIAKKIRVE
jgi:HSP20 family molecular chaperone IbpA